MKYFVKLFVITFFLLSCTYTYAEQNFAYIDMKYILNKSKAGEAAQVFLKKKFEDNQKKFNDIENNLKKTEKDLLAKKNILEASEYKKEMDKLRKNVTKYQSQRRKLLDDIALLRSKAKKQLIEKVDPILIKYTKDNSISLVLNRQAVLFSVDSANITNAIVKILDKELPSLDLK